jgi:hypothetical protein
LVRSSNSGMCVVFRLLPAAAKISCPETKRTMHCQLTTSWNRSREHIPLFCNSWDASRQRRRRRWAVASIRPCWGVSVPTYVW